MEEGLFEALKPAVETCDQQIKNVIESQSILQTYVNGLAQELKKSRVTDLPPLRASHAKLTATKKRLDTVGVTVKRINTRLENIRSLVRKRGPIGPELTEDSTDETKLRQPIPPLSDLLDWQDSR